jgi:hypothetical protein
MPTNSFSAIPEELRQYEQWILWRLEDVGGKKPTKVPYSSNGATASVTNPNDWCSFDEARHHYNSGNYSGIGFVFTEFDPFAFIDLDDTEGNAELIERQVKVFNAFDSYSEVSPSSKGLHIIVKGSIPQGRRRASIEIYSSGRYATMTGNVYANKPIADRHDLLNMLFLQMKGTGPAITNYAGDDPQIEDDTSIIMKASSALNGEKFSALHRGEWQGMYPSQSEADLAYVDMLAFYTQNRIQIERLYTTSALGRTDKKRTRKDYIDWMINKSFDRLLPKIDFDGFRIALEEKIAAEAQLSLPLDGVSVNDKPPGFDPGNTGSSPVAPASTIPLPPGLMGEIAQFIYEAAPRQVAEVAIAGAIGLMSGICGRSYNVSGTGLNQYVLLLAKTGRGKDAITSGIDKIMHEVKKTVPVAGEYIGPETINSGQALTRYIADGSNCFVSVLGEFGFTLQQISAQNANAADKMLYSNLLKLYSRSGYGNVFKPSIYSKKDDSIPATEAPAVSIVGESNPTTFYNAIDEDMILAGLLPRFLMIEYDGDRKYFNERSIQAKPSDSLIQMISQLVAYCKELAGHRKVINVSLNNEATEFMRKYDRKTTDTINLISHPAIDELWNRAHLKVLKLAAIVAIGINPYNPLITMNELNWSIPIVEKDIKSLAHKFDVGQVGKNTEELKQHEDMIRVIKEYVTKDYDYAKKYRANADLHKDKVICNTYLSDRIKKLASFKNAKIGATNALKRMIQSLADEGFLVEITHVEKSKRGYTYLGKCYAVINV